MKSTLRCIVRTGWVRICLPLTALGLLSGCGGLQPWVKPYERELLAEHIMALNPNPVSSVYIDHVFESREGAHGATGSVGGGCGCN